MISKYIHIIKRYNKLKADNKRYVILLFLSALFAAIFKVSLPFLSSLIITFATKEDYKKTFIIIIIFGICYLLYYIFMKFNYYMYYKHANYTHNKLQKSLLDKVSIMDEDYSKKISQSFLINTAYNDIGKVMQLPDQIFDSLSYLFIVISSLIIILNTNIYIGISAIVIVIIYLIFLNKHLDKRDYYLEEETICKDQTSSLMSQVFDAEKEVKSFNMQDDLNKHLDNINKRWMKIHTKKMNYENQAEIIDPIIITLFKLIIYIVVIYMIIKESGSVGMLVLIISYLDTIINNCYELFDRLDEVSSNTVRLNRLSKIINYKNKNILSFGDNDNDEIFGDISFRNVVFYYENKKVLNNISFDIKANSFTAIVGKSGSGKSTIFKLLLRLYKVKSGNIYIDGINIYDYNKEVYSSNVSIVNQKPFIFDMSIRENLSLVDSNFSHQVKACKKVGIHDFIMSLPDKYNTKLLKDGTNISLSQKQLIALARGLLSKSEILLFDEVTSSVDEKTSKKILSLMKELKKDHTIIMITHKPSMMKKADNIIVLDKGKIEAIGKHKRLLEESIVYNKLQK